MLKQLEKVKEFHHIFKLPIENEPTLISDDTSFLRYKLLSEENTEYLQACKDKNIVEVADALGDQLYIVLGTIISHGMQDIIEEVFHRIHESNMSKTEDGKAIINGQNGIYDETRPLGKVLKGRNFKEPDLTFFLK